MRLMTANGEVKDREYQIYCKDGSIIWIEENTRAVCDKNGELLYDEGIIEDIAERKLAEVGLKRQLQELQIEIDHKNVTRKWLSSPKATISRNCKTNSLHCKSMNFGVE
jgi:hypothetical protein